MAFKVATARIASYLNNKILFVTYAALKEKSPEDRGNIARGVIQPIESVNIMFINFSLELVHIIF